MYKVEPNKFRAFSEAGKKGRPNKLAQPVEYAASSGVRRIKILHPTKGWRDRNIDYLSAAMTGVKSNAFSLTPVR